MDGIPFIPPILTVHLKWTSQAPENTHHPGQFQAIMWHHWMQNQHPQSLESSLQKLHDRHSGSSVSQLQHTMVRSLISLLPQPGNTRDSEVLESCNALVHLVPGLTLSSGLSILLTPLWWVRLHFICGCKGITLYKHVGHPNSITFCQWEKEG